MFPNLSFLKVTRLRNACKITRNHLKSAMSYQQFGGIDFETFGAVGTAGRLIRRYPLQSAGKDEERKKEGEQSSQLTFFRQSSLLQEGIHKNPDNQKLKIDVLKYVTKKGLSYLYFEKMICKERLTSLQETKQHRNTLLALIRWTRFFKLRILTHAYHSKYFTKIKNSLETYSLGNSLEFKTIFGCEECVSTFSYPGQF